MYPMAVRKRLYEAFYPPMNRRSSMNCSSRDPLSPAETILTTYLAMGNNDDIVTTHHTMTDRPRSESNKDEFTRG